MIHLSSASSMRSIIINKIVADNILLLLLFFFIYFFLYIYMPVFQTGFIMLCPSVSVLPSVNFRFRITPPAVYILSS